jgi:hypothetical protein
MKQTLELIYGGFGRIMKSSICAIIFLIAAIVASAQGSGTFDLPARTGNTGNGFSIKGTVLTIDRDGEYTIRGNRKKTVNSIEVSDSVKAVINIIDVVIVNPVAGCPLMLGEGSDVRLELSGQNILEASAGKAGIRTTEAKLTIADLGDGKLTVRGGASGGAGIGGDCGGAGGDVIITGGIILVVGGHEDKNDKVISKDTYGTVKGRYSGGAGIGGGGGMGGIISHSKFRLSDKELFVESEGQGGSLTIAGGKVRAIAGASSNPGYCVGSGGAGTSSHSVGYGAGQAQLSIKEEYRETDSHLFNGGVLILNSSEAVLTLDTRNRGTNADTQLLNGTVNGRGAGLLAGFYEETNSDSENSQKVVAVRRIAKIPKEIRPNRDLQLTGIVIPETATYKTIFWSITDAGTTGATIDENILRTTEKGIVKVRAVIFTDEGNICYKQDYIIHSK